MARLRKGSWPQLLTAWLLSACLGGQTGQSDGFDCTTAAKALEPVSGISPRQLALAYQGEYRADLHWSKDAASVTQPVTLTIEASEQNGTTDQCNHQLSVPVSFSLGSEDGSLSESGQGSLLIGWGTLEPATFFSSNERIAINAVLSGAKGMIAIRGTLEPTNDANGTAAEFANDFANSAGAGGIE